MAEHRWSILCHRACVDKYSNMLSLLDVTDELQISPVGEIPPSEENPLLGVKLQLISMWGRSVPGEPERFWADVAIIMPNGETFAAGERVPGDLETFHRTRLIFGIPALPFRGPGTYWFYVGVASSPEDPLAFAARVPLEIKMKVDPKSDLSTAPEQPFEPTPPAPPGSSSPPEPSRPSRRPASPKRQRRGSS